MDEKTNVLAHPNRLDALRNIQRHKLNHLASDKSTAVNIIETVIANLKTLESDLNSHLIQDMVVEFRNVQFQIEALDLNNLPDPARFFEFADRLELLRLKLQE